MRDDQLAGRWRILRTIESKKQGATVAWLTGRESPHLDTVSRHLATIWVIRKTDSQFKKISPTC